LADDVTLSLSKRITHPSSLIPYHRKLPTDETYIKLNFIFA